MLRRIVDYQKLNERLLDLLTDKYPDGYNDEDIISFRNAQNESIEAVEIRTDDTVYLVKVGKRLTQAMEEYADDNDSDNDDESDNGEELDTSFEEEE